MRHTGPLLGLMLCPLLLAGPSLATAAATTEDPRYPPTRTIGSSDDTHTVMEEAPDASPDDAAVPAETTGGDDGATDATTDTSTSGDSGDGTQTDGADDQAQPAGSYDDYVPEPYNPPDTTGDAPPDTALVKRIFALSFAEQCSPGLQGWTGSTEPEIFDLTFREMYDDPDDPDRKMRLYRFDCDAGAYNLQSVWMTWEGVWGLRPLSFATPQFVVKYASSDDDAAAADITVNGMTSYNTLTNSWYDEATHTIHSFSKWRGLADAFDAGAWQLEGSEFVLKSFDVDASYDEKATPARIVEYPGAQPMAQMPAGADGDEVDDGSTEDSAD